MNFLNTRVDNLTFEEALIKIDEMIRLKQGGYVVTPNVDHIVQLEKNSDFQNAYRYAKLVLTDGQPLIWFSRLLNCPIKEKISGSDLFPRLCELSDKKGYTMYFLGAREGVAARAADRLKQKYPGMRVCGIYAPEPGFEKDPVQVQKIWEKIHKESPDILIVGLGTPKQELFLWRNKERLGDILAFGLGASFDFEAGEVKRAPKWMQKNGLEWLYRITREPKRLFKRYLLDGIHILPIVWKYRKVGK